MTVTQTSCRYCQLDIEGIAPYRQGEWRDRGNNTTCPESAGGAKHEPSEAGALYLQHQELWLPYSLDPAICEALHRAYTANKTTHGKARRGTRVRIWYGNPETGRDWCEETDVVGYVSRTTGQYKVPILVYNDRALGGGSILCQNVIRMDWCDGTPLYKHPLFNSVMEKAYVAAPVNGRWSVCLPGGAVHATFETRLQAEKWLDFMNGRRYRK